jgi:hypothetical protein
MAAKILTIASAALFVLTSTALAADKSAAVAHKTAFKIDPLKAMQASILTTDSNVAEISPAELKLLQDANDGHVEHSSMARAALVVCGIADPEKQKPYLAKLKAIDAECKQATAGIKSAEERAKALGKCLLKGPMKNGFLSGQSDLAVLLDTGKFNCVSSAILFNLMAPRVGIQVRAVEISGHVFSRALDFDIEPTSGSVYSLDDRIRRSLKNGTKDDSPFNPFAKQVFRETGNAGLLSSVYNNRGNELDRSKHYAEAVTTYLKAACLDPQSPGMVVNLRKTLGRWIALCKKNGDEQKAAEILAFAQTLLRPMEQMDATAGA